MKMKIRKTEQGVHFFSRDSGTNLLLDEIEMPQGELASAPANVSVAVTNRCNRSCPHCFAEKGGEDLDYEGLCGWMDELDANGCMGEKHGNVLHHDDEWRFPDPRDGGSSSRPC